MTTTETLNALSQCENYAVYEFGRIEKALESARGMAERLATDVEFTARWGKATVPTDGPWMHEPDKVQWIDPTTGLDCMVLRNHMGAWCGYVGVAFGHPFFGRNYSECTLAIPCAESEDGYCEHTAESLIRVHGGVTFNNFCDPTEEVDSICHTPAPGRPDKVWWTGFDCAHAWDFVPGMSTPGRPISEDRPDVYRDLSYVVAQTEALAIQLKAMETGGNV